MSSRKIVTLRQASHHIIVCLSRVLPFVTTYDELPALDDVVSTVDALVSDEPTMLSYPYGIESPLRSGTPSFPPGFGHMQPVQHPTPPPPPGFSRPMTPASMTLSTTINRVLPRPPVPVVPVLEPYLDKQTAEQPQLQQQQVQPQLNRRPARVASLASNGSVATTLESSKIGKAAEAVPVSASARKETPVLATPLSNPGQKGSVLQDEDFPALDAAAAPSAKPFSIPPMAQPKTSKPSTPVGKKAADKRPVPAVLNIAAASKPSSSKAADGSPAAGEKVATADMSSAFPSLPTPAAPWSPVVRSAPKTLRVVQTPKTETPPASTTAASTGAAPVLSLAAITAAENAKLAATSLLASPNTPTSSSAPAMRQASGAINRPGTPTSEIVSLSDNASVVSTSISASRAGSPPPLSRIGSAAVRNTTKSQQRKQRKQASKMDAVAVAEVATSSTTSLAGQSVAEQQQEEGAVEIAPIMGRKKKQKKDKPASVAATPAGSRESTPAPSSAAEAAAPTGTVTAKLQKEVREQKEPVKQTSSTKKKEHVKDKAATAASERAKSTEKGKSTPNSNSGSSAPTAAVASETAAAAATAVPPPVPAQSVREKQEEALQQALREAAEVAGTTSLSVQPEDVDGDVGRTNGVVDDTHTLRGGTIRDVALDMASRGLVAGSVADLPLLQPYVGLATTSQVLRDKAIVGDALLPPEVIFSDNDRTDLIAGKAVRKVIDGVRLLVTPNGDCLRNLSEAEENRFLTLQQRVGTDVASPLGYLHGRYEATGGFALISKRAVPCGLPSYFPAAATTPASSADQMVVDPVAKIQREEAVYWINQYVLPRLNLLPQSESASWQSMLADTGMPQAIGTSTVAPWIYHTPEMRNGGPSNSSSSGVDNHNHHLAAVQPPPTTLTDGGPTLDADYNGLSPQISNGNRHYRNSSSGRIGTHDDDDFNNDLENSVRAMSVEDAERSLVQARHEVETFERALNQLIRKNRRLLLGERAAGAARESAGSGSGPGSGSNASSRVPTAPAPVAAAAY